jgi:hypothetical protein
MIGTAQTKSKNQEGKSKKDWAESQRLRYRSAVTGVIALPNRRGQRTEIRLVGIVNEESRNTGMRLEFGSHETMNLEKFLIFFCFPSFLIQISLLG